MPPRTLNIYCASAPPIPSRVIIRLVDQVPDLGTNMKEWGAFYDGQAKDLAKALYEALPGGTFDRLCAELLFRQATLLKVSYPSLQKE
jgi:hypothetical protein